MTSEQLGAPLCVIHTRTKRCQLLTDDGLPSFHRAAAPHIRTLSQPFADEWTGQQFEELDRIRHTARTRLTLPAKRPSPDRRKSRPAPHPSVQGGRSCFEGAR
ncbi:hypothetical protein [Streptomyces sp. NPDC005181]|uniref:hypothetical protein n=1 Tax=Streptomyces sp. NPDC005181 TaxID=3156869 RepID=UPI0033A86103